MSLPIDDFQIPVMVGVQSFYKWFRAIDDEILSKVDSGGSRNFNRVAQFTTLWVLGVSSYKSFNNIELCE